MDTPRCGVQSTSQNMYHNENVGLSGGCSAFAWRTAKYGFDWLFFFASIF
jgi:hypothetical protein